MKNRAALRLLLLSNIISGFAQGISMLSIPWYFSTQSEDYATFGTVYIIITLSTALWGLYVGTLIDKYSRKAIFTAVNIFGCLILLSVAAVGFNMGKVPDVLIYLVFGSTIFIYNVHYPCLYAFGQEISEKENYGKMNSLIEIQGQATAIFAGAIGAILLSGTENGIVNLMGFNLELGFDLQKWSLHEIFLMDGITYGISILLISSIRYEKIENLVVHTGNMWVRLKMGLKWLKEHPLVFLFGNLSHSIFVILLVEVHLLLSPYISRHLEAKGDVYASAEIYYAIGALYAGFGIRKLFSHMNAVKAIILLMLITSFFLCLVAFTKSAWIFFLFSLVIGITNAGTRILRITWIFNRIPNNMMGRAGSVFQTVNILLRGIFILIFSLPFFMKGNNIVWAYFIGGIFIFLSAIPMIMRYKDLKE